MNKNIKILISLVIIIVVIGGIVYYLQAKKPSIKEPIKIGFVYPLSGDAASYGTSIKNATIMAIEEINNSGGILGRKVEVIFEDGKCTGKDAVTAAQKLINIDKVKIILGGGCSGETLAMAPLAEENKVLLFSSLSTSPEITNAGDYVFRNAPSDLEPAIQLADLIIKKHKKIAVVSENTDYSQAFRKVFNERFVSNGGILAVDENFNQGERDFRSYVTKIKINNPEAIFINPQSGLTGGTFVRQVRELDVQVPIYGIYFGADKDFRESAGKFAEGFIYLDFTVDEQNPKIAEFFKKYNDKFGEKPSFPQYTVLAYDVPYILKQAIENVGYDSMKIKDYLYGLKNYDGLIGKYGFDNNGDVIGISYKVLKVENDKVVELVE